MTEQLANEQIDALADDRDGPVGLHLRQHLVPIEGPGSVIFPPTYAGNGYNIDSLADGTKIATIDSVGSQANRMEPVFLRVRGGEDENPLASLVPQIEITYGDGKSVSLLKVGHRLGDAVIRCTDLKKQVRDAFEKLLDRNDAAPLAKLAPTSLVFGVWDSRETHAKLPRIVQSTIRAEEVEELRRSAQYTPPVDYKKMELFTEANTKKQRDKRAKLGFGHHPVVGEHGGVIARGPIRRDVTVNLVALRRLHAENGRELRRYVLGLALVAATAPTDGFLRAGCLLTLDPEHECVWYSVARSGERVPVVLNAQTAVAYAHNAAAAFGVGENHTVKFEKKLAEDDLKKG